MAAAVATETVALLSGCPTAVARREQIEHLPRPVADEVALVWTGEELEKVPASCCRPCSVLAQPPG